MKLANLHDLFVHKLKDVYSVEKQIIEALPKVIEHVTSEELSDALTLHLEETEAQFLRLEKIEELLDEKLSGMTCDGMKGILKEGEHMMSQDATEAVMDAGLLAAVQSVEHYEITAYGTLCTYAEEMGHDEIKDLLAETLDEEEAADEKLSELAEKINKEANLS